MKLSYFSYRYTAIHDEMSSEILFVLYFGGYFFVGYGAKLTNNIFQQNETSIRGRIFRQTSVFTGQLRSYYIYKSR